MRVVWAEKQGRLWVILAIDEDCRFFEFAGRTFPEAAKHMAKHQQQDNAAKAA